MSSSTKRRRTNSDNDNDDDIRPPAAVLSNPAPVVSAAAVVPVEPQATQIQYGSEIAKLLYGGMRKNDEQEVEIAMAKIADLVDEHKTDDWEENCDEAIWLGALGILLPVMQKFTQNKPIQVAGCQCFVNFTYRHPEATKIAVSIVKSGGIETILDAMKNFPNSASVQRRGCFALGNIFAEDNNETVDNAMGRFVNDLNGIELAVKAMKNFQDDGYVQPFGCQLLRNVSCDDVHRHALKKAGAVSAVAKAMEKHDNEDVQKFASDFLRNISSDK